jgi:hypothetical protein
MPFEPIHINTYGDVAQQWRADYGWRAEYLKYLAARCDAHVTEYLRRIG